MEKSKVIGFSLLLVALCYGLSHAAYYGEWGIGYDHPATEASQDKVKFVELGYTKSHKVFESSLGVGGWSDKTNYKGVQDAFYLHALLGLETKRDGVYANYFIGPAYITRTDSLLGSNLQISHELGVGIRDGRGVSIGFVVKHFSNAGLKRPNEGRQWIGIRARFQ